MYRDGVYYYVRRIPCDLTSFYSVKRLCFSLKTKSLKEANRSAASISQRLDDYLKGANDVGLVLEQKNNGME